jgi:hypothetical protein
MQKSLMPQHAQPQASTMLHGRAHSLRFRSTTTVKLADRLANCLSERGPVVGAHDRVGIPFPPIGAALHVFHPHLWVGLALNRIAFWCTTCEKKTVDVVSSAQHCLPAERSRCQAPRRGLHIFVDCTDLAASVVPDDTQLSHLSLPGSRKCGTGQETEGLECHKGRGYSARSAP